MKYLYIFILTLLSFGLFGQSSCETAVDICGSPGPFTGTNVGNDPADAFCAVPDCDFAADGDFATWYSFVGDGGTYTLNTNGSDFDTQIAIFTDSGLGCFACEVGDDDGGVGTQSAATITTVAGTTYFVVVDGFGAAAGNIELNITDGTDVDGTGNQLSIACPSAAEACPEPPPVCMDGFSEVTTVSYCYDDDELDAIVTEACPSTPTATVCITILSGEWEAGFDNVTFYEGAAGTGPAGTSVLGPLDGPLVAFTQVCATNPGDCLSIISNSDGIVSCADGERPPAEFTICESDAVVQVCEVVLEAPADANGCDPDGMTGFAASLNLASCTGADGPIGTGFVYDVYLYTPGGGAPIEAPFNYEFTTIQPAAEFPDPFMDGNLTDIVLDLTCADVIAAIGLLNPTCEPAVFSFLYFPFNYSLDSNGNGVGEYPTDCQVVRVDYTVYPTLVAELGADDSANCGDVVFDLYSRGGSANEGVICNTATVSCMFGSPAPTFTFTEVLDAEGASVAIEENPDGSCSTLDITSADCVGCVAATDCPLSDTEFSGTIAPISSADCIGLPLILTYTTCTFPGEFNAITGMIPGEEYCFTQEDVDVGVDGFITIIDADGVTVLAAGVSPLCFIASGPDVSVQLNLNDGLCGEGSNCYESSITCISCRQPSCAANLDLTGVCYGNDLLDEIVIEICPDDSADSAILDVFSWELEMIFDNVTFYTGAQGTGAGGTIVAGPLDGTVSGSFTSNPGECISAVVNSDDSVSCEDGIILPGCFCGAACLSTHGGIDIKSVEPAGN